MAKDKCKESGWCAPLIIYLIINVIGLVAMARQTSEKNRAKTIATSLLWTLFWSFVMYTLCSNCKQGWAWLLLILPILLWFVFVAGVAFGALMNNFGKCELPNGKCFDTFKPEQCSKQGGIYYKGKSCNV